MAKDLNAVKYYVNIEGEDFYIKCNSPKLEETEKAKEHKKWWQFWL